MHYLGIWKVVVVVGTYEINTNNYACFKTQKLAQGKLKGKKYTTKRALLN